MKVMDVPWLASGKPVVKDRAELEKIWNDLLANQYIGADLPLTNLAKFKIQPAAVLQEVAKDDKEFLRKLQELKLTKDDRVINEAITLFIVRVRNGVAKIVGHYDVGLKFNGKIFP
jgi:hypothetical protein